MPFNKQIVKGKIDFLSTLIYIVRDGANGRI